ncbi:MAG: peroxiredoxin, partial [Sulfobacillus sp.]
AKSDSATARSVFFIDPDLVIRATLTYPVAIGRNIDELLRVFDALQENTTSGGCAIPANWTRGQPTLSPAPVTIDSLSKRQQSINDPNYKAWYYKINN